MMLMMMLMLMVKVDEAEERHYSVSLPPLLVYFDLKEVTQTMIF